MIKLVPVSGYFVARGLAEITLGVGALAAAVVAGFDSEAARLGFAAAAVVYGGVRFAREQRHALIHVGRVSPPPAEATSASVADLVRLAVIPSPSAIGLVILSLTSLVFEPALAAIIGGILAGGGVARLAVAASLVWWERMNGPKLFTGRDGGRLYGRN